MADVAGIEAALKALRESYVQQLPTRLSDIEQHWQTQRETGAINDQSRELLRLIHSLAGSGASFGFSAISECARALELYFAAFVKQQTPLGADEMQEFERLYQLLSAVVQSAAQPPSDASA